MDTQDIRNLKSNGKFTTYHKGNMMIVAMEIDDAIPGEFRDACLITYAMALEDLPGAAFEDFKQHMNGKDKKEIDAMIEHAKRDLEQRLRRLLQE
jgi:hypothetical protein